MTIPNVRLNNGIEMPHLGLGVWLMDNEVAAASVATAIQAGYRLIDTATAYGNEEGVGEGIRRSGLPREDVFVTTKLRNSDQGKDRTGAAFNGSLDRLGLDYVDLYLIHWPTPMRGLWPETWSVFEELQRQGKIRAIGVCNFTPAHLDQLLAVASIPPAVLQIEFHPMFVQEDVRRYASEHRIQIESWYPLGGQGSREALLGNPAIVDIADRRGRTPAQVVLRWHTQRGLVPIPKSANPDRIRENAAIFDFEPGDDEIAAISALNIGSRLGGDPDTANHL
jgi:2,5-diketo-D-gluconate reductase A